MTGMTNALSVVKSGLQDVGWEGPASAAESLCLKVILDYTIRVVPEIAQVKDVGRLGDDVMYLLEMGFQDVDNEFLFEREMAQSLSRRDAFKRFASR
jgi:hypothetical protein